MISDSRRTWNIGGEQVRRCQDMQRGLNIARFIRLPIYSWGQISLASISSRLLKRIRSAMLGEQMCSLWRMMLCVSERCRPDPKRSREPRTRCGISSRSFHGPGNASRGLAWEVYDEAAHFLASLQVEDVHKVARTIAQKTLSEVKVPR